MGKEMTKRPLVMEGPLKIIVTLRPEHEKMFRQAKALLEAELPGTLSDEAAARMMLLEEVDRLRAPLVCILKAAGLDEYTNVWDAHPFTKASIQG